MSRDPQSYCDGAVMAYQDSADFMRNLYEKCPVDEFKSTLKLLVDGLQQKADNARFLTIPADVA